MGCNIVSTAVQPHLPRINVRQNDKSRVDKSKLSWVLIGKRVLRFECSRVFCAPSSLEEEVSAKQSKIFSKDEESDSSNSLEKPLERPLSSEELKALLVDSQRSILVKKVSEANQQNRFLKRQLLVNEDALVNFKSELAVVELEIQALVGLAEEIANYGIPGGSRKINGKYIQSHLFSRLEGKALNVAQPFVAISDKVAKCGNRHVRKTSTEGITHINQD
ncbi:hypothetical protein ACS0TY_006283 [Phlomoides rotata]